ncbi:MAG: EAL domain-containing protein, partial [Lachnospiraceae bacterium]|nr:EAL domain-containing protein [Lachnospiraceae bacterium]
YSSLTVLKDYSFDTLKMDMRFLRPFNEKSKSIMRSVITMATEIGMKTLAEGVETQEQFDFLKECGCGFIQGYYYGKPEPIDDMFRHIEEKGIAIGRRKWRHFYETAGFAARYTESPLEIIEDDGKNFKTLFMNDSYKKQIFETDFCLEEIDRKIYQTASPLLEKYRAFADQIEKSGEEESFYYTSNGMYLKLTAQSIAECDGHHIIKASITNISLDAHRQDTERLDSKARQLNLLFETVLLVNLSENRVTPIFGGFKYLNKNVKDGNLQAGIKTIENDIVYPTEHSRCHAFLCSEDLKERVEKTGCGYISDVFRTKQSDGNYKWKEFFIMMIPGTGGNEYLFCSKNHTPRPELSAKTEGRGQDERVFTNSGNSSLQADRSRESVTAGNDNAVTGNILGIEPSITSFSKYGDEFDFKSIWQNLMWNSRMKVFWKDRDCRFIGVSKSFMDYFGFESDQQVLGRTDDELKLHVDNESFNRVEQNVLTKGEKAYNIFGNVIVNGNIRKISYDLIPLYLKEHIVGIIGVFRDSDEEQKMIESLIGRTREDTVTELLNAHAFIDGLIDYAFKYNEDGSDYGIIVINNLRFDRILQSYGRDFGDKVLKRMARTISESVDNKCLVARPKQSIFAIMTRVEDPAYFAKMADTVRENILKLKEIDGNKITMKIRVASRIRSETSVADERFYDKILREVLH